MDAQPPDATPFLDRMTGEGLGPLARASFARAYQQLTAGGTATIAESSIEPVEVLPRRVDLDPPAAGVADLLERCVVIKLNGGLGTSMGLARAKSLLEVREGQTFLDVIVGQTQRFSQSTGHEPRLLFMNSFSTSADTRAHLERYHPSLGDPAALEFVQNKVPKVLADGWGPADWPDDPDLTWCPPGHGDLYVALAESGTLERLLAHGVRYAFVSNADNLGATLDPGLLAWFVDSGAPFAMEVTRRTPADRKGGHLARRRSDGQLILRESAQLDPSDADAAADIDRHRFFNTNSLWLDLDAVQAALDAHEGVLPLPVMQNTKTLDPRDPESPAVVQLETAMGAAIECFDGATAIEVPRSRFAPVKTCDDLLALRSDAYEIRDDGSVGLVADRAGEPPHVRLDPSHYKLIDGLERLIPHGAPSLVGCESLIVEGPWVFDPGVVFVGEAIIANPDEAGIDPRHLPAGTYGETTTQSE